MNIKFLPKCTSSHPCGAVVQEKRVISTMQVVLVSDKRSSAENVSLGVDNHSIDTVKGVRVVTASVEPFLPENYILVSANANQLGSFSM